MNDDKKQPILPHAWTHGSEHVLIVKCLNRDGTSHGDFVWPKAGPVENKFWSRKPDCNSGGLFGWPWGFGLGDGREADAISPWLVFRARPENVVGQIGGDEKCKAVPGEDGELPSVVYYGTMAGAMKFTHEGRIALIKENADRSSAATSGDRSSAATSGDRSIASATGEYSTLDPSSKSIAATTANRFVWKVRKGSVLLCQWTRDEKKFETKTFDSSEMKIKDGAEILVQYGEIVDRFTE